MKYSQKKVMSLLSGKDYSSNKALAAYMSTNGIDPDEMPTTPIRPEWFDYPIIQMMASFFDQKRESYMSKASQVISLLEDGVASSTAAEILASDLQEVVLSIFPDSYVKTKFSISLGESISIFFLLGKDSSEWVNHIEHNDPAYTRLYVYNMNKDGSITKPLTLERSDSSRGILIKSEDRNYSFGHLKVPFRKVTGDPDVIVKGVKIYFEKLKKILQDNRSKLSDKHLDLIGKKF